MTRLRTFFALLVAVAILAAGPALAVRPDEVLADPVMEARARDLSAELRCLVCQNQSIDVSDSDFAREIRLLLRERLVAGDSNEEVVEFLVARYGEFILLKPRFTAVTAVLWLAAPLLIIGGGIVAIGVVRRRSRAAEEGDLSPDEERELQRVLRDGAKPQKP